jgi:alpha-L-rhamnosidase
MNMLKPTGLCCEYVENPIGVHAPNPLLSWRCDDSRIGGRQTAYRIVASSTEEKLRCGEYDCWDSGQVASDRYFGIAYQGKMLHSAERVYWSVQIWDEANQASQMSDPAFFEMGLLSKSEWKGRWMGFLGGMIGNGIVMRYSFQVEKKPVKARAYIAGLGYYELHLNGGKVGDKLLDPGATDYSKTILYSAYDVTDCLRVGANTVGIILGTGWSYTPKAILQMNIEFEDGTVQEVVTDWGIGWCVAKGPIVYNSIYDGEDYDARLEKDGWCTPEYEHQATLEHQRTGGWILATIIEDPGGELIGEINEPIRITETCVPEYVSTLPDGRKVYDAKINRSGWVRIKVHGDRGSQVKLKFAEQLNADGDLDLSYMRTARAEDSYILRGDLEVEEYAPRFTYHGFRYFTVETIGNVTIDSMVAEAVRNDVKRNARFECEDAYLNQLAEVMWNTDSSNLHSIPTDCNQRDERHGWTTDTTARVEGSIYHAQMASFFEKWVRDIFDSQDETGYVADTAPHRWGRRPCDPQVNTLICLPLLMYRMYGNKRILEQYYDDMKRYLNALLGEAEDYLVSRTGFGEWACPLSECYPAPYDAGAVSMHVTPTLVSTGYMFRSASQIKEIAGLIGREEDIPMLQKLCDTIKDRYNKRFYHPENGVYDMDSQSAYALSLDLDLVEDENKDKVLQNLIHAIEAKDYHFTTGNMGTKAMLETLCNYGYEDVAYRLMMQQTSPSFGYMLKNGATSMWERWQADEDNNIMNSHNHPMFASCCTWFYKYTGGIRVDDNGVGFQQLLIQPIIPTALQHAKTEMDLLAGHVVTDWKKENGTFSLHVEIPFNTSAKVVIAKKYAKDGASLKTSQNGVLEVTETDQDYIVNILSGSYDFVVE